MSDIDDRPTKSKNPAVAAAELARVQALTAKLLAEAEYAREQTLDSAVERRITEARVRQAEAEAQAAEIAVKDVLRAEDRYKASDSQNHVFQFDGAVGPASVKTCITALSTWSRLHPKCDIEIVFNSPGGSVIDGMALWDFLTELKSRGHHLTTVCRGYAASMGGILFQVGDHRVIGRESYLMIHEISAGAQGKIGEINDAVKFYERICERVVDLFVSRSGGKITKAAFKKAWTRTDWWLTSDEVIAAGFADEVR